MSEANVADGLTLHWPGKLFSADDLRRHWQSQRELVLSEKALITPLALDLLRAKGVRIVRRGQASNGAAQPWAGKSWTYVEEQPHAVVAAAVAALERQGTVFAACPLGGQGVLRWMDLFHAWLRQKQCGVVFCADAALVCCLTNKAGLRSAAVCSSRQAGRALASIGANALVVEMPGPTFFEVRQILSAAAGSQRSCPPEIDKVLTELDAHAHR